MGTSRKFASGAAWIFYLVIVFEFLFMITPFALYFYSAYQPALALLNASPLTAWLTGFFLPHFSQTDSALINLLNRAGWWLAYLGLLTFLVSAFQLYASKLLRRGAVTGLLYRYIRHPQYLALAVLGLGATLIWPRFIVLITYVFMLFAYRWLARVEEENCERKYGAPYLEYARQTGMFLPRFGRRTSVPKETGKPARQWVNIVLHTAVLALAICTGLLLREHSLGSVSAIYREQVAIVSPAMLPDQKLADIYQAASRGVDSGVLARDEDVPLLVYVVPTDWYLPDLPIDSHEAVRRQGGHGTPASFDQDRFQVLFTGIRSHARQPRGRDILRKAHGFEPLVVIEVDVESDTVTGRFQPPSTVIWGDISPPLL